MWENTINASLYCVGGHYFIQLRRTGQFIYVYSENTALYELQCVCGTKCYTNVKHWKKMRRNEENLKFIKIFEEHKILILVTVLCKICINFIVK